MDLLKSGKFYAGAAVAVAVLYALQYMRARKAAKSGG